MQYTITSRGRPIGVTDLGFQLRLGSSRMGWFHPNADGEPLMPVITSVSIVARTQASQSDSLGEPPNEQAQLRSTLLADVAEASQHVAALDLELRRDDGSIVQTDYISIQDVDELIAWSDKIDATRDGEAWKFAEGGPDPLYDPFEDVFDEELEALQDADPQLELDPGDEVIFGDGFADAVGPWTPADYEPDPSLRYQIYVSLVNPAEVP